MISDGLSEDEVFASNVRRERERRSWSQAEMARRLQESGLEQMHPTTVSRVEKGERPVRLSEASRYADIFETSVEALLHDYPEEMDDLLEGLATMRELESRVATCYDQYERGRETLAALLDQFESWSRKDSELLQNPGNELLVNGLRDSARTLIGQSAGDVVRAHEAFLERIGRQVRSASIGTSS